MTFPTSRRTFLKTSSLAIAGAGLGFGRPVYPQSINIPERSRNSVSAFGPDLLDPEMLRRVAQAGVDAAHQAGATYADIRVINLRKFEILKGEIPEPFSRLSFEYGYGLRASVNGAWSFVFGAEPTIDAVTNSARTAVATARGMAKFMTTSPFVPAPSVQGEWVTPIVIDPFSVSPDVHTDLLGAYVDAASRVSGVGPYRGVRFIWTTETRVFASSEGSLITQRLSRVLPEMQVSSEPPLQHSSTVLPVLDFVPASAGLEIVNDASIQDHIKATAADVARLAKYPEAPAEVGRYEAVLDGMSLGAVIGSTLMRALEGERVLGYDADGAGTSFLSSVDSVLGEQLFSPQLTMSVDHSVPHFSAAKWDDEGVPTASFQVMDRGRIVDYFTTRTSATMLASWYAKRGTPLVSRGSAVSWSATTSPTGCASHLNVAPGASGASLDDLAKELVNGLLVRGARDQYVHSDQQLACGSLIPEMLYEVRHGQITRRLMGGAIQFKTQQLLSSITALGDSSTLQHSTHTDYRGETFITTATPVSAPAAHLRQADVIQIGRIL